VNTSRTSDEGAHSPRWPNRLTIIIREHSGNIQGIFREYSGNVELILIIVMHPMQVRGFAGWPGTKAAFVVENKKGEKETISLKVVKTCVGEGPRLEGLDQMMVSIVDKKRLQVECDDGSLLEVRKDVNREAGASFWAQNL
jgi:hypothetical protein